MKRVICESAEFVLARHATSEWLYLLKKGDAFYKLQLMGKNNMARCSVYSWVSLMDTTDRFGLFNSVSDACERACRKDTNAEIIQFSSPSEMFQHLAKEVK